MELYEAIDYAREVSSQGFTDRYKEYGQLADWLEELERLRGVLGDTYDFSRIRELVEADKEGRVQIIPVCKGKECGACRNFKRIAGTKRGKCEIKPYVESRCVSGKFPFEPSQSRKACLKFIPLKAEE